MIPRYTVETGSSEVYFWQFIAVAGKGYPITRDIRRTKGGSALQWHCCSDLVGVDDANG